MNGLVASCPLTAKLAKIDFLWICILHKCPHIYPLPSLMSLVPCTSSQQLSSSCHPCQTAVINWLIYVVIVKLAGASQNGHGSELYCCSLTGCTNLIFCSLCTISYKTFRNLASLKPLRFCHFGLKILRKFKSCQEEN